MSMSNGRHAMILAAGRGERMRPLSDVTPKPLLTAGGKPLIAWQIEALARAGFDNIVINVAHAADALMAALGDGARHGVRIRWSAIADPAPASLRGSRSQRLRTARSRATAFGSRR